MNNQTSIAPAQRFAYIDQFRGFIGILMLLGHSSYFFNSFWNQFDQFDPVFPEWGQFILRYAGYLCAPGYLIMAGAMVWWSFHRRLAKGSQSWQAKWHFIQRGILLVLIQITWVNSSWSGFREFNPWHLGIISCIGISMILLTVMIRWPWQYRAIAGVLLLLIHPLLLKIPYDSSNIWQKGFFQLFIDSGDFNKYPIIPWFALAILGSVMANHWFNLWKTTRDKLIWGCIIGFGSISLATLIRLTINYGNIFPSQGFLTYSFLIDQKYPPSLFMNLWFFGMVVLGVTFFLLINTMNVQLVKRLLNFISLPGKVPMFFYAIHLAILGLICRVFPDVYRFGEILETLTGFVILLALLLPVCKWFFNIKSRSNNYLIQMI